MEKGNFGRTLQEKYILFNEKYFEGRLPKNIKVLVSKRMTYRAGASYFYKFSDGSILPLKIVLSEWYVKKFSSEIESVLLHEMIHIKLGNIEHNQEFLTIMSELNEKYGYTIKVKGSDMKYYYKCTKCGKIFKLQEEINIEFYCCDNCLSTLEVLE